MYLLLGPILQWPVEIPSNLAPTFRFKMVHLIESHPLLLGKLKLSPQCFINLIFVLRIFFCLQIIKFRIFLYINILLKSMYYNFCLSSRLVNLYRVIDPVKFHCWAHVIVTRESSLEPGLKEPECRTLLQLHFMLLRIPHSKVMWKLLSNKK